MFVRSLLVILMMRVRSSSTKLRGMTAFKLLRFCLEAMKPLRLGI